MDNNDRFPVSCLECGGKLKREATWEDENGTKMLMSMCTKCLATFATKYTIDKDGDRHILSTQRYFFG